MSFKINLNGHEVTCETPEELAAAVGLGNATTGVVSKVSEEVRKKQGSGPKKSWEAAEKYAKQKGISVDEARRALAAEKRQKMAEALLKNSGKLPVAHKKAPKKK